MTSYRDRERRRARSKRRLTGVADGSEDCITGHPALFDIPPVFELGRMPEGGGYPVGFLELVHRWLGVTAPEEVLHLCSGSVIAPRTIDARISSHASIIGDVRWLPIRRASIRWAIADPPYGQDYAEAIWGEAVGKIYPTPMNLLREAAEVLVDGGLVAYLDHLVPTLPDELERVNIIAVYCGTQTRMRALTIARRLPRDGTLDL